MERKRHRNTAMVAAGILLCLVLATTSLISGMLARFASSDTTGDLTRVAKFEVTGAGFTDTVNLGVTMDPGDESTGTLSVVNKSEVSVALEITLRNTTNNLPLALQVDGAAQTDLDKFSTDGYTYTATLAPAGATGIEEELAFKLVWPAAENDLAYSGMLDNIAVTVTATQVD